MKKIGLFLIAILSLLGLSSCFSTNDNSGSVVEEKIAPIYQGITFTSNEGNVAKQGLAALERDDIEDSIENDFGVLTGEEIEYYASKGEKCYISLNFYNPSQYEILSFILNGIKYQSFQFREDSTSDKINVSLTMPDKSGINEYKIEGIKYIDGDDIKDCRMDGRQSIKVGILYDNLPSAVINIDINYQYASFKLNIMDPANMVKATNGLFRLYLFDETGVVDKKDVVVGNNEVRFEGLDENKSYTYALAASLDYYDGKGMRTHIISEGSFTTHDYININNERVDESSISLSIVKSFKELKLDSVDLLLNNEVINTTTESNVLFDKLLSNKDYVVRIKYSYNGRSHETTRGYKTKAVVEPIVNITLDSTINTISYSLGIKDDDNILSIDKVELIHDSLSVAMSKENSYSFTKLLSNNEYIVRVSYSYSLNDGNGVINKTLERAIKTKECSKPSYGFRYEVNKYLLTGSLVINDSDSLSTLDGIYLYNAVTNELVDGSNSNEFSFKLSPNTSYRLVCK